MFVDETLLEAAQDVVHSAISCDTLADRLTETHKKATQRLQGLVDWHYKENARRRDLKRLIRTALETQEAANPRPIVQLLADAIYTVMKDAGNPGYENNPLIRVILNTLLNLDRYDSHPAYGRRLRQYDQDVETLNKALESEDPMGVLVGVQFA